MARIYIASSWKNGAQPALVETLREKGHKVYDFRHPSGRDDRNVWETVTELLNLGKAYLLGELKPCDFRQMLQHEDAYKRFEEHFQAMQDADTCILLLPAGNSAHSEAGYMAGMGKRVIVMDTRENATPELMYHMYNDYLYDYDDLYKELAEPVPGVCSVCGCTEDNPCFHPEEGYCSWVTPTLCSHCASKKEGGYGIKDDPQTEHCVNDKSNAFK